jgi:nucleoside-diphosphate-sugar epimerase
VVLMVYIEEIKNKNILITGAAGFLGKSFAEKLFKNNKVVCLDISNNVEEIRFTKNIALDVRNKDFINKIQLMFHGKIDIIYHFASIVGVENVDNKTNELIDTETLGISNIIELAKTNNAVVVYSSSSSVHDIKTKDNQGSHIYPYNLCKLLSEFKLKSSPIKYIIVRLFNVYGKMQDDRMVVKRFIDKALKGEDLIIYGTGNTTRDYTHIDDVFEILNECIVKNKFNCIFDLGEGREITLLELAEEIINITHSSSKIKFEKVPETRKKYEVERRFADIEGINKLGIDKKFINLKDGLSEVIRECQE